jgi:hypothetical protein
MTPVTKYQLDESRMPRACYNIQAYLAMALAGLPRLAA